MTLHHIIWIHHDGHVDHYMDSNLKIVWEQAMREKGFIHTRLLKDWGNSNGSVLVYVDMEVDK